MLDGGESKAIWVQIEIPLPDRLGIEIEEVKLEGSLDDVGRKLAGFGYDFRARKLKKESKDVWSYEYSSANPSEAKDEMPLEIVTARGSSARCVVNLADWLLVPNTVGRSEDGWLLLRRRDLESLYLEMTPKQPKDAQKQIRTDEPSHGK